MNHTTTRMPALVALLIMVATSRAIAQDSTALGRAIAAGRAASAEIAAARAALDAAHGNARQAGAHPNPVLSYSREQTGASGASTSQDVIAVDQSIENPMLRGARRDAARYRIAAAEARVRAAEAASDLAVTRAFAQSIASRRRAVLAGQAATAFSAAVVTSERRLREGDISGFAARRIRLEAARYSALRAEAMLASTAATLALATLIGAQVAVIDDVPAPDSAQLAVLSADSLVAFALRQRGDLAAASAEADARRAEVRVAEGERFPIATLSIGSKAEEPVAGERLSGIVAGIALPLPLWDRRGGAVQAQIAEARRSDAEWGGLRRRVAREVHEALASLRAVQDQLNALSPSLQGDAVAALRSAEVAYGEGELTLLEYLDTVRAYYETETSIASLRAELLSRAAVLEHAVGTHFIQESR